MKIGLIVEGDSDEKAIPVLIKKILGEDTGVISRVKKRGDILSPKKKKKMLAAINLDLFSEHPDISKILLCTDYECDNTEEVEQKLSLMENFLKKNIERDIPVFCIGVKHALEEWLLADKNALLTYLDTRMIRLPCPGEIGCSPKQALKNLFNMHGK